MSKGSPRRARAYGSSDVSIAGAAEIARRVLVTRTMPPAGTDVSDADRAALAH